MIYLFFNDIRQTKQVFDSPEYSENLLYLNQMSSVLSVMDSVRLPEQLELNDLRRYTVLMSEQRH